MCPGIGLIGGRGFGAAASKGPEVTGPDVGKDAAC